MSTESLHQTMTPEDRAKFERGAALLGRLQEGKGFDDFWVPIGEGLLAVRRTVMEALHLKKAKSGYYREAFSRMVVKTPYARLKNTEISNLLFCMEHLADIVEMRAGWGPSERAKITHPDSMRKHLRDFLNRMPDQQAARRNVSPMALLKDKNEQLARVNLDQAERIAALEAREGDGGSLFDLKRNSAQQIVDVISGNIGVLLSLEKAEAIGKGLLAEVALKRESKRKRQKHPAPAG